MITKRAVALSALLVSIVAFANCGGSDGDATPSESIPPGAVVVTAGPGLTLDQSDYTAVASNGEVTIAYVQRDTVRHTLVVKDDDGVIVGDKLEVNKPGDVDVATFSLPTGSYEIVYCDVPGHGAMTATLRVT